MNRLKFSEKIQKLDSMNITFESSLLQDCIRGVYGVFNQNNECLYVGRSSNIIQRFIGYNGHLKHFLWNHNEEPQQLVAKLISEEVNNKGKVIICLLEKVDYVGDVYQLDMQRLASAENKWIDMYYQNENHKLKQLPEGRWISEATWDKKYRRSI
ncbi:TPA: GIY-YIG nuclease family protein [Streptococcus suis]|nr:GIY-YIG nuclease family protein [Streptococcus suis]